MAAAAPAARLPRGIISSSRPAPALVKSFAYLLPAIDYAVKNRKRVVVSTHTIALQEQLIEKDIPLLQAVYP